METGELTDDETNENALNNDDKQMQLEHNSTASDLNKQQVERPDNLMRTTSLDAKYEAEMKRRDALIQQEALDSLNLAAYTSDSERDDEVLETTTEIIEFNLNGEENRYIVKKEVQAVIVDSPDSIDVSYPIAG